MKQRRISFVGLAFVLLMVLVMLFLARLVLHRPVEVTLPQFEESEAGGDPVSDTRQEAIRRVEVTPETVQRVIESLSRPQSYERSFSVERFWPGGSGTTVVEVCHAYGWTRLDSSDSVETRHVILRDPPDEPSEADADGNCWIWYGGETAFFSGSAALSADEEQGLPTYEDILLLPQESILTSDYRTLDNTACIYVETRSDSNGYQERYWVDVETGLLAAAERLEGETLIYRMSSIAADSDPVSAERFTLPDGTVLFDPQKGSE